MKELFKKVYFEYAHAFNFSCTWNKDGNIVKFQHNIEYIVRVKPLIGFRPHWVIMTQKT